ncbi:hypothetical protein RF11_05781 [Thelohanellus kitauei]|uniref:Uncharacterized protein n=1 Tax=Thelohanellus kitauei TaxID=669202 RepID=A0A0C2N5I5_THEKT|nr:hypothetical protein RF11_05781 [Thelohanellus kitauei]
MNLDRDLDPRESMNSIKIDMIKRTDTVDMENPFKLKKTDPITIKCYLGRENFLRSFELKRFKDVQSVNYRICNEKLFASDTNKILKHILLERQEVVDDRKTPSDTMLHLLGRNLVNKHVSDNSNHCELSYFIEFFNTDKNIINLSTYEIQLNVRNFVSRGLKYFQYYMNGFRRTKNDLFALLTDFPDYTILKF